MRLSHLRVVSVPEGDVNVSHARGANEAVLTDATVLTA